MKYFLVFCLIFILGACSSLPVEEVPLAAAQEIPENATPSPIGFNKIRYSIPTGTPLIGVSVKSLRCPIRPQRLEAGLNGRSFVNDRYQVLFRNAMEPLGFDVTGDPGRLFDEVEDLQRTQYSIGARVTDIKVDMCEEESVVFGYQLGTIGEAAIEIEWTVFDILNRRNIYKTTTKGYAEITTANSEGLELLLELAFAAATHNLGTDREFFDLVFYGNEPTNIPDTVDDPDERPPGLFDPDEAVTIDYAPLRKTPLVPQTIDEVTKSVVLIRTAAGHGSGFFITDEGHILTNYHVVGNAARVQVTLSGKAKKLKAEVLRVDRKRDVALLKLEEKPDDLIIPRVAIRHDKPAVSEEVYAIGSPAYTKLQDTVTKGIISAHRYNRREKQYYTQSDAFIFGGNSGGPLVDSRGNVIGVAVAGYVSGGQDLNGLNLFIPITAALEKLNIGQSPEHSINKGDKAVPIDQQAETAPLDIIVIP